MEIGTDIDHVHFMVQSVSMNSPKNVVQVIKSIMAIEIFKPHPEMEEQLWGGKFWTSGYYINTVGKYGNAETNSNLLPFFINSDNQDTNFVIDGADRESYLSQTKVGTLESITYPTGDKTLIEYDAHDYSFIQNQSLDDLGNLLPKEYSMGISVSSPPIQNEEKESISEAFTLTSTKTLSLNIWGYTSAVFSGNTYLPRAWIIDSNGSSVYGPRLLTIAPSNSTEPYHSSFTINKTLLAGTYRLKVMAKTYLNASVGDLINFQATWTDQLGGDVYKNAGGLRIKSLTHTDRSDNQLLKREYDYGIYMDDDYNNIPNYSSGVIKTEPNYIYESTDLALEEGTTAPVLTCEYYQLVGSTQVLTEASQGYHISYREVKITDTGEDNGYIIKEFYSPYNYPDFMEQERPFNYPSTFYYKTGLLKTATIFDKDDVAVQELGNTYFSKEVTMDNCKVTYNVSRPIFGLQSTLLSGSTYNNLNFYEKFNWSFRGINMGYEVLDESTQTLDNVETITNYNYEAGFPHSLPISSSMRNSKKDATNTNVLGDLYTTEYTYVHDYTNTTIKNKLVLDNRIVQPWMIEQKVNGVLVDGSNYSFKSFNSKYLKEKFERYEYDPTSSSGSWEPTATINSYQTSVNLPSKVTQDGWADGQEYIWSSSAQLIQWKFDQHIKSYTYYSTSNLLHVSTAVDLTTTTTTYDPFLRLYTLANCQGASTTYSYYYGTSATDKSYVQTSTSYPEFADKTTPHAIRNKQFLDDIGRVSLVLQLNQSPAELSSTPHIAHWVTYDGIGREYRQYEPQAVTSSAYAAATGSEYTQLGYEASPLNRVSVTTPPSWHPSITTYGSNSATEVSNYNLTGYPKYPADQIYKRTTTDPDGHMTHTFTDKRGRTILFQDENGAVSTEKNNTYSLYDIKDRIITNIPPDASPSDADLIFTYNYEANDLLKSKKVPGRNIENYRHNTRDLLGYRQDGHLSEQSQWYALQYDSYGRIVEEGFYGGSPGTSFSFSAEVIDDLLLSNTYGSGTADKDKLTQTRTKILGSDIWIERNMTYDCGRLSTRSGNTILTPEDLNSCSMSYVYDDADNITSSTEIVPHHEGPLTILTELGYDDAARPISESLKINNLPSQVHSTTTYTPKDQISTLALGGSLQTINYNYLPNGFLSKINDANNLGTDLFGMNIGYGTTTWSSIPSHEERKNGNITSAT